VRLDNRLNVQLAHLPSQQQSITTNSAYNRQLGWYMQVWRRDS